MFRRVIEIDGDKFLMQMMDPEQIKYAKRFPARDIDKAKPYYMKLDGRNDDQWVLDPDGMELLYYAKGNRIRSIRDSSFKDSRYALWVSLLPVTNENKPYRLDTKDFPDGSLSYGGAISGPFDSFTQLPYLCQERNPFPNIEDTRGPGIPWVAHEGFLLSRIPIYDCTPIMLIEEFARAAGWRKKYLYDWPACVN